MEGCNIDCAQSERVQISDNVSLIANGQFVIVAYVFLTSLQKSITL